MKKLATRPTQEREPEPQGVQQDGQDRSGQWEERIRIASGRDVLEVLVDTATERICIPYPMEPIRLWEAIKTLPRLSESGDVPKRVFDSEAEWLMKLARQAEDAENNYQLAERDMVIALSALAVQILQKKPLAAFADIVEEVLATYKALPKSFSESEGNQDE